LDGLNQSTASVEALKMSPIYMKKRTMGKSEGTTYTRYDSLDCSELFMDEPFITLFQKQPGLRRMEITRTRPEYECRFYTKDTKIDELEALTLDEAKPRMRWEKFARKIEKEWSYGAVDDIVPFQIEVFVGENDVKSVIHVITIQENPLVTHIYVDGQRIEHAPRGWKF
jgi:hypothetical protein